jgi:hypothetical protein
VSLEALLADAVAAEAARERASARVLRQAAAEEATFTGVLVDLAERGDAVALRTVGGRTHRGVVRTVGRDFVVVQEGDGRPPVFVALAAVGSLRVDRELAKAVAGNRPPTVDASFAAVLAGLAADRPRVQVGVAGDGALLVAELATGGRDVLTLRPVSDGGAARSAVLVPVSAVHEVVLLER